MIVNWGFYEYVCGVFEVSCLGGDAIVGFVPPWVTGCGVFASEGFGGGCMGDFGEGCHELVEVLSYKSSVCFVVVSFIVVMVDNAL